MSSIETSETYVTDVTATFPNCKAPRESDRKIKRFEQNKRQELHGINIYRIHSITFTIITCCSNITRRLQLSRVDLKSLIMKFRSVVFDHICLLKHSTKP